MDPKHPSTPNLLPLQLWLAKQLPEEITESTRYPTGEKYFWWIKEQVVVTPREWDYITKKVCILRKFTPSCPIDPWEKQATELYESSRISQQN